MLSPEQRAVLEEACTLLSDVKQEDNEEQWLKTRSKGIGGSDVGAICGVNNWTSARQIYFNKTGQFQDQTEPSYAAKERMHFGHVLESVVANEFEERNPEYCCIEADGTYSSKAFDFLLANVDRLVINLEDLNIAGILECKTASESMNEEWANGNVPMSYYYQVQHYMFVTGIHRAWICCLVGGNKFYQYDIFFDEQLYTKHILPELINFWQNCVLKLQEPSTQAADDDFFNKLFASPTEEEPVELTTFDDLGDKLIALKIQQKELDKEIKALQAQVKAELGEHTVGYSPSYEFKWSPRTRTGIDSTKLRSEYPEVYDDCITTTSYRQMSIKKVVQDD